MTSSLFLRWVGPFVVLAAPAVVPAAPPPPGNIAGGPVAGDIVWAPAAMWPNTHPEATTRSLMFRVEPNPITGPTQAIRVEMVELQHPEPRNDVGNPPQRFRAFDTNINGVCLGGSYEGHPCNTDVDCEGPTDGVCSIYLGCTAENPADVTGQGGCARWVGKPGTFLEHQGDISPSCRAARLQCTPFYWNWFAETAKGPICVVGAEIMPSSEYRVKSYDSSCAGEEGTCLNVSQEVTMYTRRFGDIEEQFNPPSTSNQPNAIDIAQLVNHFKNLPGALRKCIAQIQPNLPELNANINALDIGSVVDAVKGFAYPFKGPCVCPSTVACGGSCGLPCAGGMCVKTCIAGDNDGEPCINNDHCPNGACAAAGTCRDACGRCN